MFIELMLICERRHDFLMECNFISGRGVHILDFAERANEQMFEHLNRYTSEYLNGRLACTRLHFKRCICWPCARNQNRKDSPQTKTKQQKKNRKNCCQRICINCAVCCCRQHMLRMRNMMNTFKLKLWPIGCQAFH